MINSHLELSQKFSPPLSQMEVWGNGNVSEIRKTSWKVPSMNQFCRGDGQACSSFAFLRITGAWIFSVFYFFDPVRAHHTYILIVIMASSVSLWLQSTGSGWSLVHLVHWDSRFLKFRWCWPTDISFFSNPPELRRLGNIRNSRISLSEVQVPSWCGSICCLLWMKH